MKWTQRKLEMFKNKIMRKIFIEGGERGALMENITH
jgi:hypothetical protein